MRDRKAIHCCYFAHYFHLLYQLFIIPAKRYEKLNQEVDKFFSHSTIFPSLSHRVNRHVKGNNDD